MTSRSQPLASTPPRAAAPTRSRAPTAPKPAPHRRVAGRLLKQKTAMLFRHFPAALTGEKEALHQVRVWGRRLRVALRLLSGKPKGRRTLRARRRLAELTAAAGSARDLDVLLAAFDERLRQVPARTAEQRRLRQRLAARRQSGRARMVARLLDLPIAHLRADLADLASRACPDLALVDGRFRTLCARESRRLLAGFAALGARLDVVALHALRRRARRLRYGVEVFLQVFGGETSATRPWKSLQDLIGILHDHHVLAEWLEGQAAAEAERGRPLLAAAATAEAAWAQKTMERLHDEFLAAGPAELVRRGLAAVEHERPAAAP